MPTITPIAVSHQFHCIVFSPFVSRRILTLHRTILTLCYPDRLILFPTTLTHMRSKHGRSRRLACLLNHHLYCLYRDRIVPPAQKAMIHPGRHPVIVAGLRLYKSLTMRAGSHIESSLSPVLLLNAGTTHFLLHFVHQ